MLAADHEPKLLLVQRPAVEALPAIAKRSGNGNLGISGLERPDDIGGVAAQEFQLEPRKGSHELGQRRNEQLEADAVGERQAKRCLDALLDRPCEIARGEGAFIATGEQRHDLVAKIGKVGIGTFAAKQRSAELLFELLDRLAQRWLRDMAD